MPASRKSPVAVEVEAQREAARRHFEELAARFSGERESEHVRRGLTRAAFEDEPEGTPAERAILQLLQAIRADQLALREEVERLRAALDPRARG